MVSLANDVHLGLSTLGEGFFCGVVFITGEEIYVHILHIIISSFFHSGVPGCVHCVKDKHVHCQVTIKYIIILDLPYKASVQACPRASYDAMTKAPYKMIP